MSPGFFLVVEGPEGAGKSTLAKGLAARFAAAGIAIEVVPGVTPAKPSADILAFPIRQDIQDAILKAAS